MMLTSSVRAKKEIMASSIKVTPGIMYSVRWAEQIRTRYTLVLTAVLNTLRLVIGSAVKRVEPTPVARSITTKMSNASKDWLSCTPKRNSAIPITIAKPIFAFAKCRKENPISLICIIIVSN